MAIEIKHLCYTYSKGTPFSKAALCDVSFTIPDGSFFGVIGHTGSGKSTLIQHLNALLLPQSGDVLIDGVSLADKKTDRKAIRRKIGLVFQYPEYQLFAESVFEDVAFGYRNLHEGKKTNPDEVTLAVRSALEMVGLDYEAIKDVSPFELSGGQKRRVAFAGVIVTRPEVLILDEPTAGLDPSGKKDILELVHMLKREICKTVVMIGHDMDEISLHCDRILVLADGKVQFVLPPDQLFLQENTLLSLGLDLPTPARVAKRLRAMGMDLPVGIYTEKALCQAIAHRGGDSL